METILVAHGTRSCHGVTMIGDLAEAVGNRLNEQVRIAFVDVLGPSLREVLAMLRGQPAVVIPAFLSSGFHVRHDIPSEIIASGHPDVTVTDALGPSPELARVMLARLCDAGWRPGDDVVLAAAGTRDPLAQSQIRGCAAALSALVGVRVEIAFAAIPRDGSGYPTVPEVVKAQRNAGAKRVAVASYLLAEGMFQRRLHASGADVVSAPIGVHPTVVKVVCARRRQATVMALSQV